ncbi:uncharacterized protein LOC141614001 [Silene latifolia]|uniref:uncharacterized protein LOC141614001 n=1 Tax=Silene latifolia TaxID=37657 RepID=UPI003D7854E1
MLQELNIPTGFIALIKECVTTATYTLNLNEDSFGWFKGQRGLRKGDPLSPLLFTICMEYLTILLAYTTSTMKFRFYPLCKSMKLSSLMFADDLLLFSKGDVDSIMILLRTFSTFSQALGLQMSRGKSNVYFNGVYSEVRREIVQVSGCIEGKLPFKYLGVPIKPSKLSIKDCQPLIDKVLDRIRQLGTKKLSYAGRLVLIKAVYRTLHSYWASIFIIPKAVLLKIEASAAELSGMEGLRTEWENYNPPQDASWTWKKVCKLKKEFQPAYHQNKWAMVPGKEYTIKKGYRWLRQNSQDVSCLDSSCCICAQEEESPRHLFFQSAIWQRVLQRIQEWTGVTMSDANTQNWWQHKRFTRLENGILNSILNAAMYYIWKQRNASRHEGVIISPGRCVVMIQGDIRNRIRQQLQGTMSRKDKHWIEKIMQ